MSGKIKIPVKTESYRKAYSNVKASYLNRIRWAVGLYYFTMGLCFATWASRIPDIKTKLGLTEADLGTVLFAIPVGQLVIMPFSGTLATKYGSHKTALLALSFYLISLVTIGFAEEEWQLLLSLFFFGMCSNLTNISINTQGIYTEGLFRRPIMSAFHGAWSIAGFTGALVGLGMIGLNLIPLYHFAIIAVVLLIVLFTNYKYLIRAKKQETPAKKNILSKPDIVLVWLGVMAFGCMMSEGIMFDWSGVYFKEVVKAPGALVVLGYASFMIMMAAGRFFGDRIIRKLGRKRVLQISGCFISVGLLTSVFLPYLIPSTIAFMMVGLGVSTIIPTIYSIAGRRPGIPPGIALQTVSSVSFLGFMLGPPVIGYVAQATSLKVSFAIIATLGFGITILVSKVRAITES